MADSYSDIHGTVLDLIEFKRYGSGPTYTNPNLSALLGLGEQVIVHAIVNEVGGASPTLTVSAEDSADGENWADLGAVINAVSISSTPVTLRGTVSYPHGRYLRFKFSLGGAGVLFAVMGLRATLKDNR
jgi:hypothetical protein